MGTVQHKEQHGLAHTREYNAWCSTLSRCRNPKVHEYPYYGGRGITVKFQSFAEFYAEVGPRPPGTSLDRINNDGHYESGNVRWATKRQQLLNRCNNRRITWNGRTQALTEWAEEIGITVTALHKRLTYYGYTVDRALTEPLRITRRTHRNKLPDTLSK